MVVSFSGAKLNQNSQGKSIASEIMDTYKELSSAIVMYVSSLQKAKVKIVFPASDCSYLNPWLVLLSATCREQ